MSDFSALIASVESYIRQNGNNEITGNILQEVLVGIISTLGTQSINALETGLSTEQTTRANADAALSGRIDTEESRRQQGDTALGGRIDGLVGTIGGVSGIVTTLQSRLDEGYIYKGIATPTTNPSTPTGKVFYVAVQAGTYTHFDEVEVANGITILTYDGEGWDDNNVITFDDEPTEGSTALPTSGGTHAFIKANTLEEIVRAIADEGDIAEYFVDKKNACFGYLKTDGTVYFHRISFTDMDNDILNRISSPSPYQDTNILKYLIDDSNTCFGYVEKDGTVVLQKARIESLEGQLEDIVNENQLSIITGLLAVGVDNIEMSNNPKMMAVLKNVKTEHIVKLNADNENTVNLQPCISIIDDDTIDYQIPASVGNVSPTERTGGYFSVLLPMMLSLGDKYGKSCPVGLACEGHRVGLTTFRQANDDYSVLNMNGEAIRFLHDNLGWNVLNHSMTAQLPQRSYYVDGIDSPLAATILANGYYSGYLAFSNTIVLDRYTGKWYEVNADKTAWVERVPTKKYAMPFYRDYETGAWYFNRDFDFEYSWGEWLRRADELGLPYEKIIVHNGGTTSAYTISAGRKYAYASVRTNGVFNNPPLAAAVNRTPSYLSTVEGNAWEDAWVEAHIANVDHCEEAKSWMVLMTHANEGHHANYYVSGTTYPSADPTQPSSRGKDDNYPSEWTLPLKNEEIIDIIGDNTHGYITTPPSRLGISRWRDWHPAGGTQLAAIYYVLDYALSKGIDIVAPTQGLTTHGNILNIGVDKNGQEYAYDSAEHQVPLTDEEKSFLTVGANMEIRLFNAKNQ